MTKPNFETENDYISFIQNIHDNDIILTGANIVQFLKKCATITENIALTLCRKIPIAIIDPEITNTVTPENKHLLSEIYFEEVFAKNNPFRYVLSPDIPISKDIWDKIRKELQNEEQRTNSVNQQTILTRNDTPDDIREICIKELTLYGLDKPYITTNDVIIWLNYNKQVVQINYKPYKMDKDLFNEQTDLIEIIKHHPWLFKYLKKQTAKLSKAAIEANPFNIQYVKKPSDKLCILALKLNPKTEIIVPKTEKVAAYLGTQPDTTH